MRISGKTKVVGLLGYPVEHSLSPAMHNAAFRHLGLDYCYVSFPVAPGFLRRAIDGVRALDISGANVTVPHKEDVIAFLDEVSEEASFIGAVNTILNSRGILKGHNTDGRGFMQSLYEAGITVRGKSVLIVGAGGACRAISYYISAEAEVLKIYDIDHLRRDRLVRDLSSIRSNVVHLGSLNSLEGTDVIINATPLGLKDNDPSPIDTDLLTSSMSACDLIYKETAFLKSASEKGCKTLNGLGMLLHQGVLAFEIWTGVKPPIDIMRKALAGE
ncbi:MAG TPA: shikimate dehydrogenase [Thermodesulfovibrionales bacterium]|nr:shikimate dehydrogenase [Thermodesulfovibrionales bacterium]